VSKALKDKIGKAAVQMLLICGGPLAVQDMRDAIAEEIFPDNTSNLSTVMVLTALLDMAEKLSAAGIELCVESGIARLRPAAPLLSDTFAMRLHRLYLDAARRLAQKISEDEDAGASTPDGLTTTQLEILACVAFKQPIMAVEVERVFGGDKRAVLAKLKSLGFIDTIGGDDGRLRYVTTDLFLQKFHLRSLDQLYSESERAEKTDLRHATLVTLADA
jgi:Predicted transcriptional regulator containing the HTH domain